MMIYLRFVVFGIAAIVPVIGVNASAYTARILRLHGATGESAAASAQVGSRYDTGLSQALLWFGSAESEVNLHPTGFVSSQALGVSDANQVGYGYHPSFFSFHALLWNGTAASVVDLHPDGFIESYATDTFSVNQVGYGSGAATGLQTHALLWNGSAESFVDLHPVGFDASFAAGAYQGKQIGTAEIDHFFAVESHAILWSGSSASAVDLHPDGFDKSVGRAVFGNRQVGWGVGSATDDEDHALLWHDTADSVVDLHPEGFLHSYALDVFDNIQVGFGRPDGSTSHALAWKGTAESVIDLHQFLADLPIEMIGSEARGISANGTIIGHGYDRNGNWNAILWTPVPEPSTALLIVIAVGWALLISRRGIL